MDKHEYSFGTHKTRVIIQDLLPRLDELSAAGEKSSAVLVVCDTNTESLAKKIMGNCQQALCVLPAGESYKNWQSIETILSAACKAGLSRGSLMIGIGGGVITDMTAFAASLYMRGCNVALVSTTLLGMADAVLGGKSGIDLLGIKNLAGTFYPASMVYMPVESLCTLPLSEWKSGMAEVIKSAVIGDEKLLDLLEKNSSLLAFPGNEDFFSKHTKEIQELIERCTAVKGRIVEADPLEKGTKRALLNLGHTFGHALEAAAGLGKISHGEAVAWGMARACELGKALGRTSEERALRIHSLLTSYGYEIRAPHPAGIDNQLLLQFMQSDKKKNTYGLRFVVPEPNGACLIQIENDKYHLVQAALQGEISL